MTRDDIVKWARESGGLPDPMVFMGAYERFADLVAAAEREACENAVEDVARKYQKLHHASLENIADECAAAIRARGTT